MRYLLLTVVFVFSLTILTSCSLIDDTSAVNKLEDKDTEILFLTKHQIKGTIKTKFGSFQFTDYELEQIKEAKQARRIFNFWDYLDARKTFKKTIKHNGKKVRLKFKITNHNIIGYKFVIKRIKSKK